MSIITRAIVAIIIAIGAFSIGSNSASNDGVSIEAMNDDSLSIVEDYNNIQDDDEMARIDCHDGNEMMCLRYVWVVGEDSFWIDSDGNASRVPFLHAAYYMDRGSLSMDYYSEWLEAFKAKICVAENDVAACMADIESMNSGALSR